MCDHSLQSVYIRVNTYGTGKSRVEWEFPFPAVGTKMETLHSGFEHGKPMSLVSSSWRAHLKGFIKGSDEVGRASLYPLMIVCHPVKQTPTTTVHLMSRMDGKKTHTHTVHLDCRPILQRVCRYVLTKKCRMCTDMQQSLPPDLSCIVQVLCHVGSITCIGHQPGMVANSACGQLTKGKYMIPGRVSMASSIKKNPPAQCQ